MKLSTARPAAALVLCLLAGTQARRTVSSQGSVVDGAQAIPAISKVLSLLYKLKAGVETDGVHEQRSYDKYQCWCESIQGRKVREIAAAKESVDQSQTLVIKLKGELASHEAEVKKLNKDISSNRDASQEAMEVRDDEATEYAADQSEAEQCIGALEAAIMVLSGAGIRKGAFLSTMQQARLLSTAADLGRILQKPDALRTASAEDVETLQRFLQHPAAPTGTSALQASANPFGDYAPQSNVILGILKGMHENFKRQMEEATSEEAAKLKAFKDLMSTKQAEMDTLQGTLQQQEMQKATKGKLLADAEKSLKTTKVQLKADKVFLEENKATCREVSLAWSERSRLRSEEIVSFNTAIGILTSPEATAIFANSSATFVQVSAIATHHRRAAGGPGLAYDSLRELASKHPSASLAQVAVAAKAGGSFDKVVRMIDHMVASIRKEEADDIAHRDRCENSVGKSSNDLQDLESTKATVTADVGRMEAGAAKLKAKLEALEADIQTTQAQLQDMLQMRNQEQDNFAKALKDDTDAAALVRQAIVALKEYYRVNQVPLLLAQQKQEDAPKLEWSGDQHRKGQSKDIISILAMIVEDLEMEIKTSREQEAAAQQDYEKEREATSDMLHALKESLVTGGSELADLQAKTAEANAKLAQTEQDIDQEQALQGTLAQECDWVATHFDSRRAKRKAELEGLADARSILAGADKGDYAELELSAVR